MKESSQPRPDETPREPTELGGLADPFSTGVEKISKTERVEPHVFGKLWVETAAEVDIFRCGKLEQMPRVLLLSPEQVRQALDDFYKWLIKEQDVPEGQALNEYRQHYAAFFSESPWVRDRLRSREQLARFDAEKRPELKPRPKYRRSHKRAIWDVLLGKPDATDIELCRSLDERGFGVPASLEKNGDRTFLSAYRDPARKNNIESMFAKVRAEMRASGSLIS